MWLHYSLLYMVLIRSQLCIFAPLYVISYLYQTSFRIWCVWVYVSVFSYLSCLKFSELFGSFSIFYIFSNSSAFISLPLYPLLRPLLSPSLPCSSSSWVSKILIRFLSEIVAQPLDPLFNFSPILFSCFSLDKFSWPTFKLNDFVLGSVKYTDEPIKGIHLLLCYFNF